MFFQTSVLRRPVHRERSRTFAARAARPRCSARSARVPGAIQSRADAIRMSVIRASLRSCAQDRPAHRSSSQGSPPGSTRGRRGSCSRRLADSGRGGRPSSAVRRPCRRGSGLSTFPHRSLRTLPARARSAPDADRSFPSCCNSYRGSRLLPCRGHILR